MITRGFGGCGVNFYDAPFALDPILTFSGLRNWSSGFESGLLFMTISFLTDYDRSLLETLLLIECFDGKTISCRLLIIEFSNFGCSAGI